MSEVATTIETAGAVRPSPPTEKVEPKHIGQRAKEMLQEIWPKTSGQNQNPDATLQKIATFPIQESEQQILSQPIAKTADETSLAEAQQAKTEIAGGRDPDSSDTINASQTFSEHSAQQIRDGQNAVRANEGLNREIPEQIDKEPQETTTQEATESEAENALTDQEKFTIIVRAVNRYKKGTEDNSLTPDELQLISNNITKNLDVLKTYFASGDKFNGAVNMLREIGQFQLTPELSQLAQSTIENCIRDYATIINATPDILHNSSFSIQRTVFVVSQLLNSENLEGRISAMGVLNREFARWGVKSSDFLRAWSEATGFKGEIRGLRLRGIPENLPTAIQIESQRPGIIKVLSQEFGVKNFGRYPQELLVKQYDERDDKSKPYGVVLYPRSDWNGAFLANQQVFGELSNQLDGKSNIRVVEAESKYDIARALINFRKRYPAHKISFAIVGGHGTKDSILFGGTDQKHLLHVQDLLGKGVRRTSEFFDSNPSIILVSCSTGTEGGIGQQLSEMMGAKVIAPEIPTNISSINSTIDSEGKVTFTVKYVEEQAAKSYLAGQREIS